MDNLGVYTNEATEVSISYEMLSAASVQEIEAEKKLYNQNTFPADVMKMEEFIVAMFGVYNKLPTEVKNLIKNNHLLPEMLSKQVRIMYGDGPTLYKIEQKGEDDNKKKKRTLFSPEDHPAVWEWLESWKKNGLADDLRSYLKKVIREYYYLEGYFSKWLYNKSRRINGAIPIRGLEFLPSSRCRIAKKGEYDINMPLEYEEMTHVLYGRWDIGIRNTKKVFNLFNDAKPLRYATAISYVRDLGFDDEIYSFPTFYFGSKEWIKGSNLNPKYANSFLKNSLAAKVHVIIPNSWFTIKEKTLKNIVEQNMELQREGKPIVTEYEGLKEIGVSYSHSMVNKLVKIKLREITELLAGEGENQGKAFISRSIKTEYGIEEWQFKDIPSKYSEFMKSIIEYDKRAVEVITQSKGMPPSISNVSKDGIFQSSGSDIYYNYMIYLNSLVYAEEFICDDINKALHINFPELKKQNIKLGFDRNVPARQEELPPKERLENTSK